MILFWCYQKILRVGHSNKLTKRNIRFTWLFNKFMINYFNAFTQLNSNSYTRANVKVTKIAENKKMYVNTNDSLHCYVIKIRKNVWKWKEKEEIIKVKKYSFIFLQIDKKIELWHYGKWCIETCYYLCSFH